MNANSGYIGYSLSVRANRSYIEGYLPKTKFMSHFRISEIMFQKMVERDMLDVEWHHTSKFFNKTKFYKPNEDGLVFLAVNNKLSKTKRTEVIMGRLYKRMRDVKHSIKPISFESRNGCNWVVIQEGADIQAAEIAVKYKCGENATISRSGSPTHYHIHI